ncbi:MAG TPA: bifunctional YncE family protein/alkaline phosphatase family protein [Polyangia bacterium]
MRLRIAVCALVLSAVGCGSEATRLNVVECAPPAPPAEAVVKAGPQPGGLILPGGRALTPAGLHTPVGGFPVDVRVSPRAAVAYVGNSGYAKRGLQVVDLTSGAVLQDLPRAEAFLGLAVTADGGRVYAAGGYSGLVDVYDAAADGTLTHAAALDLGGFPAGLALAADDATLYVGQFGSNGLAVVDTASGTVTRTISLPLQAYGVALVPGRAEAYVTPFGDTRIAAVDLAAAQVAAVIDAGAGNPLGVVAAPDGGRVYVSVADGDRVLAIDTATRTVAATVALGDPALADADGAPLPGVSPTGLALDAAGGRLYVARAADNAIAVLDAATLAPLGAIPTGWYPSAVALDAAGATLVATNAKGLGTGPLGIYGMGDESGKELMNGSVSIVTLAGYDLAAGAATVDANLHRPAQVYPYSCAGSAVVPPTAGGRTPPAAGGRTPIEHIVLVVRENKTYDSLLGDLGVGDGDPSLAMFGEDVTPNIHALARRFAHHDNFYNDGETSVQGHLWLTSSFVNDYMERIWLEDYRGHGFGDQSVQKAGQPDFGTFFTHLIRHGVSFTNFGEVVGSFGEEAGDSVMNHTDLNYPGVFFNTDVPDEEKARYAAEALVDRGPFPQFVYVLLPNDHTHGTSRNSLTPEAMISDNDYATGLLVERLSKSRYWDSTAIFIVEDDPQQGADHVEYHRSICVVASPWAKRGHVSPVHTSFPSLFRTFELILGLPPMNRFDALATPLWDAFGPTADFEPYTALPRTVADTRNPAGAPGQALSDRMDFSGPDRNPDLGAVLWWARRGAPPPGSRVARMLAGEVPPTTVAAAAADADGDGDDERERDVYDRSWRRFEAWLAAHPGVKADLRPRRTRAGALPR